MKIRRKGMISMLLYNAEIDKNIKSLITTMNETGWMITRSCCEGHSNHFAKRIIKWSKPYISLLVNIEKLSVLSDVLTKSYKEFVNKYGLILDFNATWDCLTTRYDDIENCICDKKDDIPCGYIIIDIKIDVPLSKKKEIFKILESNIKQLIA